MPKSRSRRTRRVEALAGTAAGSGLRVKTAVSRAFMAGILWGRGNGGGDDWGLQAAEARRSPLVDVAALAGIAAAVAITDAEVAFAMDVADRGRSHGRGDRATRVGVGRLLVAGGVHGGVLALV